MNLSNKETIALKNCASELGVAPHIVAVAIMIAIDAIGDPEHKEVYGTFVADELNKIAHKFL